MLTKVSSHFSKKLTNTTCNVSLDLLTNSLRKKYSNFSSGSILHILMKREIKKETKEEQTGKYNFAALKTGLEIHL